jgi:hypothetical protein
MPTSREHCDHVGLSLDGGLLGGSGASLLQNGDLVQRCCGDELPCKRQYFRECALDAHARLHGAILEDVHDDIRRDVLYGTHIRQRRPAEIGDLQTLISGLLQNTEQIGRRSRNVLNGNCLNGWRRHLDTERRTRGCATFLLDRYLLIIVYVHECVHIGDGASANGGGLCHAFSSCLLDAQHILRGSSHGVLHSRSHVGGVDNRLSARKRRLQRGCGDNDNCQSSSQYGLMAIHKIERKCLLGTSPCAA